MVLVTGPICPDYGVFLIENVDHGCHGWKMERTAEMGPKFEVQCLNIYE